MLKRLSLRMRLTLLSAMVMAGVAVMLTGVFLVGADHIFVRNLQNQFVVQPSEYSVYDVVLSGSAFEETEAGTISFTIKQAGNRFNVWGIAGLVLMLVLGTWLTWLMAGRALKPLEELTDTIEDIGGHNLARRVEIQDRQDEIGQLALSFNRMMDKVSASFERQRRFSASAAHELKTPLATILVNLDVLNMEEQPSPDRTDQVLAVVRANTERMIRLVDDLFRLSAEKDSGMCEDVPLKEVFREVVEELSPRMEEKQLSVSVSDMTGMKLAGNRVMITRAMGNLVENAVKYNRQSGSVSISAEMRDEKVWIQISDTGIGIPREELTHIFEPFYRVDQSRSRAVGGAGLGLALVKDIVEKHGGDISVESVADEGTVFLLCFPTS